MVWTAVSGCIEVLHSSIILEVVHSVLKSALGREFFTLKLAHKSVLKIFQTNLFYDNVWHTISFI